MKFERPTLLATESIPWRHKAKPVETGSGLFKPVRTAKPTVVENWRRLYENSHRPGSLSHLLAKKVYNYASNTTGTPSGSTDYFYAYDPVGNVVAISNGAGTRTYAFTQDAWGNELSVGAFTGDSWTTARNAGVWEHQTGKWIDGFTGLYYFHARFYDSKVGRFVGRDKAKTRDTKGA